MPDKIEPLIEVLEKSESIYQQLLPVFQQEKKATLSSQPDRFSAIVEEKEALLAQLRQLDRQRHLILHQISKVWNIPVNDLRLSTVADKIEGPQSARIRDLRMSLKGLIQKIKRSNEENRLLIQHCLDIVQGTLGFFHQMVIPKDVYGASGRMSLHNGNGKLVSGAV
ncbi:MAG: flagellar protein FlgN [Desulfobacteraceae bacterium]|jgi:flagellar biosynthesis/type III secretory pathway chaperone